MPEGDSVALAAARVAPRVVGRRVVATDLRTPRLATARLDGQRVTAFVPRGKHMLLRTDAGWTLHSHFRMTGSWQVLRPGSRLPRAVAPEVRAALALDDGQALVGLRLPVLDLLRTADEHLVVGHLGPDLLGADWDEDEAVRRLARAPERPVVEALLDQRNLAGAGNLWAVETCFLRGVSPWSPVGELGEERLRAHCRLLRKGLQHSVSARTGQSTTGSRRRGETHWVYGRAGQPCRRCGTPVAFRDAGWAAGPGRASGEATALHERETWWCPACQPGPAPSLAERPSRPTRRGDRPRARC